MITRIRYSRDNGRLTNVTPLFAKNTLLTVNIDLIYMEYVILNDEGTTIIEGVGKTKQQVLNMVKSEVKRLGVLFHDEIRPRKKTKDFKSNADELVEGEVTNVTTSNIGTN